MTETLLDSFLRLLSQYMYKNLYFLEEITCTLNFNVIVSPCALEIILYQEIFPTNYAVFKYAVDRLPGIRL